MRIKAKIKGFVFNVHPNNFSVDVRDDVKHYNMDNCMLTPSRISTFTFTFKIESIIGVKCKLYNLVEKGAKKVKIAIIDSETITLFTVKDCHIHMSEFENSFITIKSSDVVVKKTDREWWVSAD